jgi:thiosulfate dehydrogenase [quinone] large subunit
MSALRRFATPLGLIAAALLIFMVNPWFAPPESISGAVTIAFWVLLIVLIVVLFEDRKAPGASSVEIEGPAFTRFLFSNSRAGLFWLPIRLFVGFSFFEAGLHKLLPEGKAMGAGWLDGGASLLGFWERAVAIPEAPARAAITFEWYRDFLNVLISNDAQVWFGWLIVFGELAVGIGLIFGVLTGIAAFFGVFMNMSFLLAGTASTNPVLFGLGMGLILAWRVAGYYGLDRYLLPALGVPWKIKIGAVEAQPVTQPAKT